MFDREFYSLSDLASRWGCSIADLLHLGIQGRAQICANIYGMASNQALHRTEAEPGVDAYPDDMPDGIFEIPSDALRFMDMPDGFPFELYEAHKFFSDAWWNVDFDPPVTIRLEHLVMLRAEVARLDREKQKASAKVNAKPTLTDNSLLGTIAALLAAWPGGKSPSGKDLEKAAESVGVAITDDTIRKAMNAARGIAKRLPPA